MDHSFDQQTVQELQELLGHCQEGQRYQGLSAAAASAERELCARIHHLTETGRPCDAALAHVYARHMENYWRWINYPKSRYWAYLAKSAFLLTAYDSHVESTPRIPTIRWNKILQRFIL